MSVPTTHSTYRVPSGVPPEFQALFDAEDNHFWFRARNRIIAEIFETLLVGKAPGYGVLEVGCGDGNVLRVLERVCSEGDGLEFARRRNSRTELITADVNDWPFEHPFEFICLFDVLEHIEQDAQTLHVL